MEKEKDHVEGFAPEVAWVTYGGLQKLQERLCVRPTSETLFCDFYKNDIQSYRDLPKVYNQWCNVVRWEKETRPFLRSREFLWQEGHTAHATAEEAEERTIRMLNEYADFAEQVLAIPVIKGRKTEKEKFAGAEATYTIEALMHDGKALQSGTSHNFGDGFAKAFEIQYSDKENKLQYVHQTSWGMTTRMIGAIIMVHGDDSGLVLPPKVAPTQIMIVPIMQKKEGVLEKAEELRSVLASNFRVKVDDSDKSPGFKFAEQEVKGIPLRVEVGPKDIEAGQAVVVRRDTREKTIVPFDKLSETCEALLAQMHDDMYAKAKAHRDANTHVATNWDEFTDILDSSRLCGVARKPARQPSRTRQVQQRDVSRLHRRSLVMYVYIVASLRNTWFILERHTKNRNQNIYPADISGVVVYLGEIHENRNSDRGGIYFTTIK